MRVYCTGRHSEPHDQQPVYPILKVDSEVFECPLCKYDVRVDRDLEDDIEAEIVGPIELHRLAQVVTRLKQEP